MRVRACLNQMLVVAARKQPQPAGLCEHNTGQPSDIFQEAFWAVLEQVGNSLGAACWSVREQSGSTRSQPSESFLKGAEAARDQLGPSLAMPSWTAYNEPSV